MRLIHACVVAGAASLLIGVPAASAAPALTIKPKNREILYGGKSTKITGHLSGVNPNSGQQIRLQANPYPYNGFVNKGALKRTDANGNFVFIVKPDRNTRYRALLPGTTTTSPGRAIYVNGVTKWKNKPKGRTIHLSFTFTFSPQVATSLFSGVPLRWYFRTQGGKFHRVRTNKTKRLAEGVIGGKLDYTYPNSVGKKKYFVSWCFRPKQSGDVGVGVPGKAFKKCA
ncbi:MAG: hypothetical protein QOJ29_4883 [Thermoleophilaceae bacterium]|nr:hypothetical protein [Thermoleophilaceae bacterium]